MTTKLVVDGEVIGDNERSFAIRLRVRSTGDSDYTGALSLASASDVFSVKWFSHEGARLPVPISIRPGARHEMVLHADVPEGIAAGVLNFTPKLEPVPNEVISPTLELRVPASERIVDKTPPHHPKVWWIVGAGAVAILLVAVVLTYLLRPPDVRVPSVVTLSLLDAESMLQEAGLELGDTMHKFSADVAEDQVLAQAPPAGEAVARGSPVDVTISASVSVPDVVGLPEEQASELIKEAGLEVTVVLTNLVAPWASVVASQPIAGARVEEGSSITLTVARIPESQLLGLDARQARSVLEHRGLQVSLIYDPDHPGQLLDDNGDGCRAGPSAPVTNCVVTRLVAITGPEARLAVRSPGG